MRQQLVVNIHIFIGEQILILQQMHNTLSKISLLILICLNIYLFSNNYSNYLTYPVLFIDTLILLKLILFLFKKKNILLKSIEESIFIKFDKIFQHFK